MKYYCIGEHLPHSFSRELHRKLGNNSYEILELPKEKFDDFIESKDFDGVNITIPYKETVIKHLDFISREAESIGAVNTVVNKNGKLCGYNTDFYGLKALIKKANIELKDKKVLILGTGGTSKTSKAVAKSMGAKEIYIVSRKEKNGALTYDECYEKHSDADVIINTTPCGMYPQTDAMPINIDKFGQLEGVVDVVYNPLCTALSLYAKSKNIKTVCGLYMLVYQAVCASELFFDKKYDEDTADKIYREMLREKQNIVLIGMPSAGKTTVGKILAKEMNREFYDLDEEIVKEKNMEIAEIFRLYSEETFRKAENETVKNTLANKNSCVISLGGGTVLNRQNVSLLRQNSKIYFLDRPIKQLTFDESRPLAKSAKDIEKLFAQRYDIYRESADVIIKNDKDPYSAAMKIRKDFENANE